jgi:hypothetical protein
VKLLAAAGDISSTVADVRLATPLLALAAQGGVALRLRSFHDCMRADLAWADVLVLQRPTSRRAWLLLQGMQKSGGQVWTRNWTLRIRFKKACRGCAAAWRRPTRCRSAPHGWARPWRPT